MKIMKNRFLIYALVLIVAILAIVYWWRLGQHTAILEPKQGTARLTNQLISNVAIRNQNVSSASLSTPPVSPKPSVVNTASVVELVEKLVNSRNVPIHFYGQFFDQDNHPIPGVKINIVIQQLTAPNPALMELGSKYIR